MSRLKILYNYLLAIFIITLFSYPIESATTTSCPNFEAIICSDSSLDCQDCLISKNCWLDRNDDWTFVRFRESISGCGGFDWSNFNQNPDIVSFNLTWRLATNNDEWDNAEVAIWKDPRPYFGPVGEEEDCIDDAGWGSGSCEDYITPHDEVIIASRYTLSSDADTWGKCGSAGGDYCFSPDIKTEIGDHVGWSDPSEVVFLFLDPVSTADEHTSSNIYGHAFTSIITSDLAPVLSCPDNSTIEDEANNTTVLDIWTCHTDQDDPDSSNIYNIVSQENVELINCFIDSNRYLKCNPPTTDQNGFSEITIQANDGWRTGTDTLFINVTTVNDAPSFVNATTARPNTTTSVEQGTSVLFEANINDVDDNDDVTLLVCDNQGLSGSACAGTTYCSINSTQDGFKSCSYDTSTTTSSSFSWTSFACDKAGSCASSTTGTHTVNRRPSDIKIKTDSTYILNDSGFFVGPESINGFESILENKLQTCQADAQGYCLITLNFTSNTIGKLNLSDLKVQYTTPISIINLTNLTSSYSNLIFEFQILNSLSSGNYSWSVNFGDGTTVNSTISASLGINEKGIVLAQYAYAAAGTYTITASASNGTHVGLDSITVKVT